LALVLACGAQFAYWRFAVGRMQVSAQAWIEARRHAGWTVAAGAPSVAGFPFAASLTFPAVALRDPGGLTWNADAVTLKVYLLHPSQLEISPAGAQRLRTASGFEVPYRADRLAVSTRLDPEVTPHEWDIAAGNLRAGLFGLADAPNSVMVQSMHVHLNMLPSADPRDPAVQIAVQADGIDLPPNPLRNLTGAFGTKLASLALDATVSGPVPPPGNLQDRASAWREAGGTVSVSRAALDWGPLNTEGRATVALDPNLQPMGTGVVTVRDYAEALDAMAIGGVLPQRSALALKSLAGLLVQAKPSGNGAPEGAIEFPVQLQNQTLSARQFPIARLPSLVWP
jgi:hypothetical protein